MHVFHRMVLLLRHRAAWCHFHATLLITLAVVPPQTACGATTDWPLISIPDNVSTFPIGQQLTANGVPMRLQGLSSNDNQARVAARFRLSLGTPLVENAGATGLVLGRAQDGYYLTVNLQAAGSGTRGWIAVSQLAGTAATQARAAADILSSFPAGSRLVSQTSSVDAGKKASHILITNAFDTALNVEHIKTMMRRDGMRLEREKESNIDRQDGGRFLFFKNRDQEATAGVYRSSTGQSLIIVNTRAPEENGK